MSTDRRNPRRFFRHAITLGLLCGVFVIGVVVTRSEPQRSAPALPNPSSMKIEYRPGGYFPKGFPLHGKVRLLTPPIVEMGQRSRVRVEYTVGDMLVEQGMTLEIWKHFTSDSEEFQVENPNAPAWFGVEFSNPAVKGKTYSYTNWSQRNNPSVFPYRKAAAVDIVEGRLEQGSKVNFDLGGPQGARMQHYAENLFNYRIVILKDRKVMGYAGDAAMQVTGGPLRKLRVHAPSIVKVGESFPVEILPQDEWGSLANDYQGLSFRITSGANGSFTLDPELKHYIARDFKLPSEGVHRISLQTADGRFKAISNPIWAQADPIRRVYYGDVHQHTYLHDGRGVYEELYMYARQVGLLDFGAVTPHHMPMSVTGPSFYLEGKRFPSENWPDLMRATKLMNGWKGFVSILGYEYSVGTDKGGHHNVFFNADEAKTTMQLDPVDPAAPIAKMMKTLQLVRKPTLVIPHIGGGPPDWSHPTDPRMERLFEIASVHGVFEDSWQKHLESGQRVAASAAGDTHTVAMGNAYPGLIYVMTNGLTGVYATGKSRPEIWDGMYDRRTFGVTGNTRILMDFSVNGESMGGSLQRGTAEARIEAKVSGTSPVMRVDLLKNSKVIHSIYPARNRGRLLRVTWGDNIYNRRAALGMTSGELRPEGGAIELKQKLHLDQAFETIEQDGGGIKWRTAAVSNDRDGFLADISNVTGGTLRFRLDDSTQMGVFEVEIPIERLKSEGHFSWNSLGHERVTNSYMAKMGVAPRFYLECELTDGEGPMDANFTYLDRGKLNPGDYYYLRMEQMDTNKAWSSPVWVD